jgi:hypothetical protein
MNASCNGDSISSPLAYLVAEPAEDAGADAGEAGVADVPAEGAPHPDRDEDADHLLARDAPERNLLLLMPCRFLSSSASRNGFACSLPSSPVVQRVADERVPLHGGRSLLGTKHVPRIQGHDLLEPVVRRQTTQILASYCNLTATQPRYDK